MNDIDATTPTPPSPPPRPVPPASAGPAAPPAAGVRGNCENCGTRLLGEHCYVCGQPVKGLVRHFSSVMGDFLDTVLQWDSRLPRTLAPLLARPGYLTREYFAGRRVRFVSPVRLFFTLSIVTFFFAQLVISFGDDPIRFDNDGNGFDKATTVEEVIRERDDALKEIAKARNDGNANIPSVDTGLRAAEEGVRRSADARIATLQKADPTAAGAAADARSVRPAKNAADEADQAADAAAAATGTAQTAANATSPAAAVPGSAASPAAAKASQSDGEKPSTDTPSVANSDRADRRRGGDAPWQNGGNDDWTMFDVGDKPWDPKTNPVTVSWLPAWANTRLNALTLRAQNNLKRMRKDPDEFKDAVLSAVPSTLFVLLPVFALMLKIFYIFKRRLYMEHLIVALHSHAFLCLALLLMFAAMGLRNAMPSQAGFFYGLLGWCEAALWIWMPLYLLLMQKRVYQQGWWMTLLKYAVLGQLYIFLLSFGAVFTVMFSVVWG